MPGTAAEKRLASNLLVNEKLKRARIDNSGNIPLETVNWKHDKVYVRNQQQSPLLRLPGEIRNVIYVEVLGGQEVFTMFCDIYAEAGEKYSRSFYSISVHPKSQKLKRWKSTLALVTVCRQTYEESRLLPFKQNRFHIFGRDFKNWIESLTNDQRNAITTVSLDRNYNQFNFYYSRGLIHDLMRCERLKKIILFGALDKSYRKWMDELVGEKNIELIEKEEQEVEVEGNDEEEEEEEEEEEDENEGYYAVESDVVESSEDEDQEVDIRLFLHFQNMHNTNDESEDEEEDGSEAACLTAEEETQIP